MALDCRSPIDFGPSASSPSVRPSTTTTTTTTMQSFCHSSAVARARPSASARCSVLGSGFGLEDTSGFRLSSLSFPPSLPLYLSVLGGREGRRPTRAFDSSEFRLRAGFIVVVFVFVSPSVSERGLARSRLGSETLPSLGRFSLSFASEYSES